MGWPECSLARHPRPPAWRRPRDARGGLARIGRGVHIRISQGGERAVRRRPRDAPDLSRGRWRRPGGDGATGSARLSHAGELHRIAPAPGRRRLSLLAWLQRLIGPSKPLADHASINYVDRIH